MKTITKNLISISVILSLLFLGGCSGNKNRGYALDLEIWGIFDDSGAFANIVSEYKKINPFIRDIKYRKIEVDNYKKDLLDALASGQGPDIIFVRNAWLTSFEDKIVPAPDWILGEREFRDNFVDVAASDFIKDGKIYAAPLSVDSLALYYNKDLFNAAGIARPPATWEELLEDVKKLTRIDKSGEIIQQGIAMGTAYNVNRSTDLLNLIMFQMGIEMTGSGGFLVEFTSPITIGNETIVPGEKALEFYAQFARSNSPYYCWNPRMHYSLDAFYENTAAMMINYSWHYQTIKSKNAKLSFDVAPVPQFEGKMPANFANYWGLAVTKNKVQPEVSQTDQEKGMVPVTNEMRVFEAWEFIKFLTAKNSGQVTLVNGATGNSKSFPVSIDPAEEYVKYTGRPAARRDLLEKQKSDPTLGPFAYGNLIAKNWPQPDPEAVEGILAEAIDSVNFGRMDARKALELAANRINQLIKR